MIFADFTYSTSSRAVTNIDRRRQNQLDLKFEEEKKKICSRRKNEETFPEVLETTSEKLILGLSSPKKKKETLEKDQFLDFVISSDSCGEEGNWRPF
jgi:hypothetical protein